MAVATNPKRKASGEALTNEGQSAPELAETRSKPDLTNEGAQVPHEVAIAALRAMYASDQTHMQGGVTTFTGRDGKEYTGSMQPDGTVTVQRSTDRYGIEGAQARLYHLRKALRLASDRLQGTQATLDKQTVLGAPPHVTEGFTAQVQQAKDEFDRTKAEIEAIEEANPSIRKERLQNEAKSLHDRSVAKKQESDAKKAQHDERLESCSRKVWTDPVTGMEHTGPDDRDRLWLDQVADKVDQLFTEAHELEIQSQRKYAEADPLTGLEGATVWEFKPGDTISFQV